LTATAQTGLYSEGLWCQLLVVIVYSSTMIGICPELSGSDRILEPIKHTAAQAIIGMNGGRQDRRFCNPLVAIVLLNYDHKLAPSLLLVHSLLMLQLCKESPSSPHAPDATYQDRRC
jgi:hypothetical protein